jgi:hypothetical protein
MDKKELKSLIKPIIKECIREVLMEEGLRKVVNESVTAQPVAKQVSAPPVAQKQVHLQEQQKVKELKREILHKIGKSGYSSTGFDPFGGTAPLAEGQAPQVASAEMSAMNPLRDIDPNDPGVDISGIMGIAAGKWNAHMGRKNK